MHSILRLDPRINLLQHRNDLPPDLFPDCPLSRSRDILPRAITSLATSTYKETKRKLTL